MKKRNVLIVGAMVGCVFLGSFINESRHQVKKITPQSSSMIAMYIQDEEGNYNLSDAQEFPKDGYVLNTEKSSCKNGGVISQNSSTKALSLKVKTSDECSVYFDVEKGTKGTELLLSKTNDASITSYTSGNKKEMFVFNHPEATQTAGWSDEERRDYRYIGSEPNNYITFNDEIWRIIGVFTVENENGDKEQLIKIMRNVSIGEYYWNSHGKDDWANSSLQLLLNNDYYNCSGSYSDSSSIRGLNEISQLYISKVKWYLGGAKYSSSHNGPSYYDFERGIETCATTNYCSGQTRTTNIIQNVGLMYPSDYIYTYANGVNNKCFTDGYNCKTSSGGTPSAGWIYNSLNEWTQSPGYGTNHNGAGGSGAFFINKDGDTYYGIVNFSFGGNFNVRPALYLSSTTKIVSGDGSLENPYQIE